MTSPLHLISLLANFVILSNFVQVLIAFNIPPGVDPDNLTIWTVEKGKPETYEWRMYFKTQHGFISPMHDIPIFFNYTQEIYHMIVESPKGSTARMTVSLEDYLNPIVHRTDYSGIPRYFHYPHLEPKDGYLWNYGAIPNTWESTNETDSHTGRYGDGHLLDIIDIGKRTAKRGEILRVKVLGCLAFIDGHKRIDYKIISIDINDPKAANLTDISDALKQYPEYMEATREWFEFHGILTQKRFAFVNGEFKNRDFTTYLITISMTKWLLLTTGKRGNPGVSLRNTICGNLDHITFKEASRIVENRLLYELEQKIKKNSFRIAPSTTTEFNNATTPTTTTEEPDSVQIENTYLDD